MKIRLCISGLADFIRYMRERGIGFEFKARSVYYRFYIYLSTDYLVAEAGEKEIGITAVWKSFQK